MGSMRLCHLQFAPFQGKRALARTDQTQVALSAAPRARVFQTCCALHVILTPDQIVRDWDGIEKTGEGNQKGRHPT